MFLVTDTKEDRSIDIILAEFGEIRRAAGKVNIEILNRVVPQIYNPEMLQLVQSVWDWPSIIYTLYQSPQTPEEVIDFIREHDEIHGVTMWPGAATDEFIAELKKLDRVIYCHTINNFGEAFALCSRGVHGLYTCFRTGCRCTSGRRFLRSGRKAAGVCGRPQPPGSACRWLCLPRLLSRNFPRS